MDGYDNDILMLLLDDDLFPREEDTDGMDILESESALSRGRRLHDPSDQRGHRDGLAFRPQGAL